MRTSYDLEMMREIGFCPGIENYSRHLDGREPGERPYTLLDYFPDDYLTVIDESHVTIPQIHGQFAGDRSRKNMLIEHGFRLPSAMDNRPLTFEEWFDLSSKLYCSLRRRQIGNWACRLRSSNSSYAPPVLSIPRCYPPHKRPDR